jgi:CRISPR/Cas system-associated exonuclease Cas4 (RecB family)
MVKGKAIHKGIELNYQQKIETHEDLPVNDVVDMAVAAFEDESEDVDWDKEDELEGQAKDAVAVMTESYQCELAPKIQPIAAEKKFLMEIGDIKVVGIIDVITERGVRDTKTTTRAPQMDAAYKSLQLACYSLAYRNMYDKAPEELTLDYIVNKKSVAVTTVRYQYPSVSMENVFINVAKSVHTAITHDVFHPNIDGWHCSSKWCGYYNICMRG